MSRIGLLAGFCLAARALFADGGTVQFQKQAGPFMITLFSTPVPVRVGAADLSVMVQKAEDRSEVLDAGVVLQLFKPGIRAIRVSATRGQASNKLLYAAPVVFPSSGAWQVDIEVDARGAAARVTGNVAVLPEQASWIAYWPYFAIVPIAVALFALNQRLKARRRITNRRARS